MISSKRFELIADYQPGGRSRFGYRGDYATGSRRGLSHQTLLGSDWLGGRLFSIANVIQAPTTPGADSRSEQNLWRRSFMARCVISSPTTPSSISSPITITTNRKRMFPTTDTYIEKDASINEHIEQMRLSATKALLERLRLNHRRYRVGHLRARRPADLSRHGVASRAGRRDRSA